MNIQSWMIKSWATHEWYLPPEAENLPCFSHVSTQIRDEGGSTGLRAGDTVWMAQDQQRQVGLAWEWVEVKPGLVMLADPNSIITNLQLVDSLQQHVVGLEKTVAINRLVHAMCWQQPVCDLLMGSTPPAQDDHRSLGSCVTLTQSPLLRDHSEYQHSTRPVPAQSPSTTEATERLPATVWPAVVHMGKHAAHQAGLHFESRSRNRSSDREADERGPAVGDMRRAA